MQTTKKWWQSKTMWVNIVSAILGFLTLIDGNLLTSFGFTEETKVKILSGIGLATTVINMILRWGNPQPISTLPQGSIPPRK
jgi:hypothetical protein